MICIMMILFSFCVLYSKESLIDRPDGAFNLNQTENLQHPKETKRKISKEQIVKLIEETADKNNKKSTKKNKIKDLTPYKRSKKPIIFMQASNAKGNGGDKKKKGGNKKKSKEKRLNKSAD